jgi:hypothetical protein
MIMDDSNDSLIVLNEQVVALPRLKIMVRTGRFNLEMNGVQEVSARLDPLLEPHRLWMPESDSPYYITPDRGGPMPRIPFFSDQAKTVCEFGFSGRHYERTYIYSNPYFDARLASLHAQSLSKTLNDDLDPFKVLHLILTAIGQLRDWPVPIKAESEIDTMQVCLGRSFVAKIEAETGLSFPPAGVEECILSEWPYEPHSNSTMI